MRAMAWAATALCCLSGVAQAAPQEAEYGAVGGYPIGTRTTINDQRHMVGSYTAMDRIYDGHEVKAGGTVRALPAMQPTPDLPELQGYLDSHPVTGLLILKDGRIVAERYQYARKPEDRFTSWSMAKTVLAMAIGIAIAEGRIASVDDPVDKYEPALASSGWKGIAIRHVLNMASGVRFDETYGSSSSDVAKLSGAWARSQGTLLDVLTSTTTKDAAPGERFKYSSADSQVLGQVLVKATGQSVADYVSARIWAPMGAEADAFWITDRSGMEAAYCCLNARLRDYARFGQLLLDGGQVDGRQVIPREWIEAATSVRLRDGHLQPKRATPFFGYGYQIWVFPDQLGFALLGVRGQSVFVHPRLKLVMVQTAVWPSFEEPALGRQRVEFWRSLVLRAGRM